MEKKVHEHTPRRQSSSTEIGNRAILGAQADSKPYDYDWREAGVCRNVNPEIFFPEKGKSVREAKKLCGMCPVKDQCLENALVVKSNNDDHGVWGGTTERERREMRKKRKAAQKQPALKQAS